VKRLLHPRSIRGKLTLWLLAVFALLSLLHIYTYYAAYGHQRELIMRNHEQVTQLIGRSIDSELAGMMSAQQAAGQFLLDRHLAPRPAGRYLRMLSSTQSQYVSISFLTPTGVIVASSDPSSVGMDLSPLDDVRPVTSGKPSAISGPHWSVNRERSFALSTAVREDGRLKGIVRTEVRANSLVRHLPSGLGGSIAMTILDQHGTEVYSATPRRMMNAAETVQELPVVRLALERNAAGFASFRTEHDRKRYIASAVPVCFGNWALVATQPADDLLQNARSDFAGSLRISLIVTAALLVFFWWQCGIWLLGNIRRLTRGAAALSVGDLRKRIRVKTGDELESLSVAFNQMAESLEIHARRLAGKSSAMESLLEVAQTVSSSLDPTTVAGSISGALCRHFGAAAVAVYLFDDNRRDLKLFCYESYTDASAPAPPDEWTQLARQAYDRAAPVVAPDRYLQPGEEARPSQSSVLVGAPLVAADKTIGSLIGSFAREEFDDSNILQDHVDLLRAFGSHAAVALQNALTYSQAEEYSSSLANWLDELSALRYVTEAITGSLDLKEILQTLSKLSCDVMKARASAILLMDSAGMLSIGESFNLSARMRTLCKCRIDDRLCGVSAAEKRPVSVRDLAEEHPGHQMASQATKEGLSGFLSVPLISGREVIGVISIWMAEPCDFTPYQIDLLSSIAAHAAMVIHNARLFGKEYRIAETLQSVLLGNVPPKANGLELGSKYVPALDEAHVGGDFYDAISLPGGKLGVVIADVSGKGLEAAMHTAMCKYMVRGFAYHLPNSPAEVLRMANDAICGYAESKFFVTMFYCVIDPAAGACVYANAGHPPGILITENGQQQTLLYQTGMPIGLETGRSYKEKTVRLTGDDTLILYTDGFIDARQGDETLGIEGLQGIVFAAAVERDPQTLVERLYTDTLLYAKDGVRDDMAVVAVHSAGIVVEQVVEARRRWTTKSA
jgi:serine phosphatase RsbU (regulator of sigma subunit)/HAMP domain-containing protein